MSRFVVATKRSIENSRANALRDWNFKGTAEFRRNDVCGSYALVRMPRVIDLARHVTLRGIFPFQSDLYRRRKDFFDYSSLEKNRKLDFLIELIL